MKVCFHCKKELDVPGRPGRGDGCPFCGSDLRACLNCRFYDRAASNECREPSAERVVVKDRANFCEFFEFRETDAGNAPKDDPMKKLKDLFK